MDMATHLNIVEHTSENVKLKKSDKSWKSLEKRYKEVFGSFLFLVNRPSLVIQAFTLHAKRGAVERLLKLPKLYPKIRKLITQIEVWVRLLTSLFL